MRFLEKAIDISFQLFPKAYSAKDKYKAFHFAYLFERNNLISIGQNSYSFSNKALYFANRYSIFSKKKYPSLHAEIDAFSKAWGKYYIDSNTKLVVIRINRFGEFQNSRPCKDCYSVIQGLNINKVWYSTTSSIVYENISTGEIR